MKSDPHVGRFKTKRLLKRVLDAIMAGRRPTRPLAAQLFDIVVCFQHMLARSSIHMLHVQLNENRSDRFLSSHSVPSNVATQAEGHRVQSLDSPIFQTDRYSRPSLTHYNLWMF